MIIQPSSLLAGTDKTINVVNGCIIAKEGPNMISKLGLNDLSIDYDSVFTSRQTLAYGQDYPIMYGFLGTDVSFILVKPDYGLVNPQQCSGTTGYLEYWFEDQPLVRRTLTDLLVLTGNASHKIPQVYLYNPNGVNVNVDLMVANIGDNSITTALVSESTVVEGLSYNVITTDQMYGLAVTGSSQFEILDINDDIQLVIPYNKIDIIEIDGSTITVTTTSDDPVKLNFLSTFNANQAMSRMNWVIESSSTRWITKTYPGLDTTGPVITMKAYSVPEVMTGIVTKADLTFRFIDYVTDYDNASILRDGLINNDNVDVLIINNNTGEQLSAITSNSSYSVTFTATDVATNSTSETVSVVRDDEAPTIYYLTGYTTNIMDLTGNTQTPGTITKDDVLRYYVDYVWDAVDGIIPNSAITITLTSGVTDYTTITEIGYYTVDFSVQDSALNTATGQTTLLVIESVAPVITYNDVFTGTGFTMSLTGDTVSGTGATQLDIATYAISGVTDNYDGTIDLSEVVVTVTGTTCPLIDGLYDVTFSVSDSSSNTTTSTVYGLTID